MRIQRGRSRFGIDLRTMSSMPGWSEPQKTSWSRTTKLPLTTSPSYSTSSHTHSVFWTVRTSACDGVMMAVRATRSAIHGRSSIAALPELTAGIQDPELRFLPWKARVGGNRRCETMERFLSLWAASLHFGRSKASDCDVYIQKTRFPQNQYCLQ